MGYSKRINVKRDFKLVTNYFSAPVLDRSITIKTKYEYYITKWDCDCDEVLYIKKVNKKTYEQCGYIEQDLRYSDDEFSKDCKQFVVFETYTFFIRIEIPKHSDAEYVAKAIANDLEFYMEHPIEYDVDDYDFTSSLEWGSGTVISFIQKF